MMEQEVYDKLITRYGKDSVEASGFSAVFQNADPASKLVLTLLVSSLLKGASDAS